MKENVRAMMPAVIAVLAIIGYFGLLFLKVNVPDTVNVLIVSVISFYFGSHVNGVQTAALTSLATESANSTAANNAAILAASARTDTGRSTDRVIVTGNGNGAAGVPAGAVTTTTETTTVPHV